MPISWAKSTLPIERMMMANPAARQGCLFTGRYNPLRYFGGIKLGVSGLITAYKTTAQLTLQEAEIEERTIDLTYQIVFDYKDMNKVMKIIKDRNLTIVSQTLELNCTLLVEVRKAEASYVEQLFEQLYEVTITPIEG